MAMSRDDKELAIKEAVELAIELEALGCERDGMKAENAIREHRGEVMAYDEAAFSKLAERIRALLPKANDPAPVDKLAEAVKAWSEMDVVDMTRDNLVAKGDRMRDAFEKRIKEQAETIRELEARLNAPEPDELIIARRNAIRENEKGDIDTRCLAYWRVWQNLESYIELLKGRK